MGLSGTNRLATCRNSGFQQRWQARLRALQFEHAPNCNLVPEQQRLRQGRLWPDSSHRLETGRLNRFRW